MNHNSTTSLPNRQPGLPDEQLLQYYVNGDPSARAILVELYKDRIFSSIYTMVPDQVVAAEIFHSVFARAIDNMITGRAVEEGEFLPWAIQIAHGLCMEYKRDQISQTSGGQVIPDLSHAKGARLSQNHHVENHDRLRRLIEMLPATQREVILLNHYGGLTFNEIAALTKSTVDNALQTMRYALRSLQKLMLAR